MLGWSECKPGEFCLSLGLYFLQGVGLMRIHEKLVLVCVGRSSEQIDEELYTDEEYEEHERAFQN